MFRTDQTNVFFGLFAGIGAIALLFALLAIATWKDCAQFSRLSPDVMSCSSPGATAGRC